MLRGKGDSGRNPSGLDAGCLSPPEEDIHLDIENMKVHSQLIKMLERMRRGRPGCLSPPEIRKLAGSFLAFRAL